jgi:hypothetical protein
MEIKSMWRENAHRIHLIVEGRHLIVDDRPGYSGYHPALYAIASQSV